MGKEFYFETDDRLDRKKYAEFLKTLIENCDDYRREDSDGAYVIAIDSPWGTGKTRFAKMLRNYLEDRTKDMSDDSSPGKKAVFNAIYYNSWDTDFSNDALQPLIHTITRSPEFKPDEFGEAGEEILEKFKKSAIAVAKVAGFALIHHFLGETAAEVAKALDDASSEVKADPLEEYQSRLDLLQGFKDSLRDLIAHTKQKKLVIIVDELDRCRPTYAIQTLEVVKHLFDVNGLVFIFALDIKQLSCSIKTVYGQDMESIGYLCRFFDYISNCPNPNYDKFIADSVVEINKKNAITNCASVLKNPENPLIEFIEFVLDISKNNPLSYRDITTLLASYRMLLNERLQNYTFLPILKLYFLLLFMKYKYPAAFIELVSDKGVNDINGFVANLVSIHLDSIMEIQLLALNVKKRLDIFDFFGVPFDENGKNTLAQNGIINGILRTDEEKVILTTEYPIPNHVRENVFSEIVKQKYDIVFNYIIIRQDLEKWEAIKNFTPMQYYYQQLEMFNFAFSADNTPPEA